MERDRDRRGTDKESYKRKERTDLIFGVHAVIEAIKSDRELNKILIQKGMN
jgi:tRNA G18 (ribose-2'-O)-methylase SpoU